MNVVQRLQDSSSGDRGALEALLREHQHLVFQLALTVLDDGRSPDPLREAGEAAQAAFLTALRAPGSYRPDRSLELWLGSIALRTALHQLRRRQSRQRWQARLRPLSERVGPFAARLRALTQPVARLFARRETVETPPATPAGVYTDLPVSREDALVWQTASDLNEKERLPLVLRYFHDYPLDEIAQLLGISRGTAHARLRTGRLKMERALAAENGAAHQDPAGGAA